jgi:hypothetical protein
VTWVRRGVAKPEPERVKLTQEELAAVISQTKVLYCIPVRDQNKNFGAYLIPSRSDPGTK